jgi:hypothetical protein
MWAVPRGDNEPLGGPSQLPSGDRENAEHRAL